MRYEQEPLQNPEKEEERNEVYVKRLNLITPEYASHFGVTAEAPVFVSPYQKTKGFCECGHCFTRLVYRAGETTMAQHFHENTDQEGGIYLFTLLVAEDIKRKSVGGLAYRENWLADMEPVGRLVNDGPGVVRAEGVSVKRIYGIRRGTKVEDGTLVAKIIRDDDGNSLPTILFIAPSRTQNTSEYKGNLQEYCDFQTRGETIVFSNPRNLKQRK